MTPQALTSLRAAVRPRMGTARVAKAAQGLFTAAYRVAYMHQHGLARTLREMIAQEGHVMALGGL